MVRLAFLLSFMFILPLHGQEYPTVVAVNFFQQGGLLMSYGKKSLPVATPTATISGPVLVQQKTGTISNGDLTITLDTAATSNNQLFLCLAFADTDTVSNHNVTISGDELLKQAESLGTGITVQVWANVAIPPTSTVTIHPDVGLTRLTATVMEFSGVTDVNRGFDGNSGLASTSVTTDSGSGPLPATGDPSSVFIACAGWRTNNYSSGPTNSFTRITAGSGTVWLETAYLIQNPSSETLSTEWTLIAPINWTTAIVVFPGN